MLFKKSSELGYISQLYIIIYLNFWLVVFLVNKFLGRGISCRYIFGSWWLVVGRGGSWWLVVGRGGSYVVLETALFLWGGGGGRGAEGTD